MKEKLRLVRTLLEKRSARRKAGQFVVEGPHLVETAAEAGQIDYVFYAKRLPLVSQLKDIGIECYELSDKEFAAISEVETPQGILAVVNQAPVLLSEIEKVDPALIVAAIEIQDPGNLGTIIRSADAVGATAVLVSRGTVDPFNSKVVRASMGSLFNLPVIECQDIVADLKRLKDNGMALVSTEAKAAQNYFATDFKKSTVILLGNEAAGVPQEITALCDQIVSIPMPGKAESLNAAMAATLLLYEVLRQRNYGS